MGLGGGRQGRGYNRGVMADVVVRRVESRQNARVKELRAALGRGAPSAQGLIALEGLHLLAEAVKSGLRLQTVFVRAGSEGLLAQLAVGAAEVLVLAPEVFASAAATEHPQGIAGPGGGAGVWVSGDVGGGTPLIVVAGGLQDPGNLGTLVRSAEAFGATGMILLPGTVSLWNGKTLRASSGSAFRLPVVSLGVDEAFAWLGAQGIRICAAVARDGESAVDLRHGLRAADWQ